MVVMLSSIGLPGLNGFVGEFLILLGTYLSKSLAAEIAVVGLILGALYMLYAYERVWFGPITKAVNETIADLSAREIAVMAPLMVLMLFMGLYPRLLLSRMEPSVGALLGRVHAAQARIDRRQHDARAARRAAQTQIRGRQMTQFNWSVINFAWVPILPLIVVAAGAMGVLLAGVQIDDEDSGGLGILSIALFVFAAILRCCSSAGVRRWLSRARSR